MKLPPRRVLRFIVQDAISDRREFIDANPRDAGVRSATQAVIGEYKGLLPRLADDAPALSEADRDLLAQACMHARIWREGMVDSWRHTGDKAAVLDTKQDVQRIDRTEEALGVQSHWLRSKTLPEGVRLVSIFDIPVTPEGSAAWADLVA